jgi:hypothetical protein
MKRIIILSLSLFFAITTFAQMAISFKNNALVTGDSNTYMKIPFVDPGNSGADQIWDFSKISSTGEMMISTIPASASGREKSTADFNLILNERGSDYFFRLSADYFMEVGAVTKDYTLNFSDPIIKMIYPFAYGNHFADNFSGLAEAPTGQKVDFNGVYSVSADAYGTLVLPDRTYTDVLRVRTESNGLEINQCNSVEAKAVRYLWYAPGYRYPVLNVSVSERRISGGEPAITKSAMLWAGSRESGDTPAGNEKPRGIASNDEVTVVVYPNPFTDKLNYHYFLRKSVPASITISDVTGRNTTVVMKQVMQSEGLYSGAVDANDFDMNPGVYYIRFVFDGQVVVKKVVKL